MASKKNGGLKELIIDYQEASESARGCSQRIFQSFYLSLVFLAFIITAITTGYDQYPVMLPITSILSAIAFFILHLTIHMNKGARNSAWARRQEIESKIGGLKTNESITKRLVAKEDRHKFGGLKYKGKDWRERRSAATWMEYFALAVFIGSLIVFEISSLSFIV